MLKESVISIASALYAKNIPFSIYRFPGEKGFRLAVPEPLLPHEKNVLFWMTPFSNHSDSTEFSLCVVNKACLNERFLETIRSLPSLARLNASLPVETSHREYLNQITAFLEDIHSGKLEKAILSRAFYVDKPTSFDPISCFKELADDYSKTLVHLTLHPQSGIWMGATPELLLQKRKATVYTMALAGTQARQEREGYYWRPKELEEHAMVEKHIEDIFAKSHFTLKEKGRIENFSTGHVVHLKTNYIFDNNNGYSLKTLVKQLHPTPAVGGLPVKEARDCILQHERYDRKYYCGIIGETDFKEKADLFVNLRCMQVGKEKVAIYVGGGITAASDPNEEWEETIIKGKMMAEKIEPSKALN